MMKNIKRVVVPYRGFVILNVSGSDEFIINKNRETQSTAASERAAMDWVDRRLDEASHQERSES